MRNSEVSVEPAYISSWRMFPSALREMLAERHYAQPHVVIRHYDRTRTAVLQRMGTDRDQTSRLWDYPEDIDHHRSLERVNPVLVTYARTLDLTQEPIRPIPIGRRLIDNIDNLDYLVHLPLTSGMSVYTPEGLRRVSENEYHFMGDPREALLAIFLNREIHKIHPQCLSTAKSTTRSREIRKNRRGKEQ